MNSAADWIVVAGFLFAVTGVALRIVIMMRSSDANPVAATPLVGRDLVRSYRVARPASKLPLVMWISIAAGSVLLIAGMLLEFR
jgi:hypothetical protein